MVHRITSPFYFTAHCQPRTYIHVHTYIIYTRTHTYVCFTMLLIIKVLHKNSMAWQGYKLQVAIFRFETVI